MVDRASSSSASPSRPATVIWGTLLQRRVPPAHARPGLEPRLLRVARVHADLDGASPARSASRRLRLDLLRRRAIPPVLARRGDPLARMPRDEIENPLDIDARGRGRSGCSRLGRAGARVTGRRELTRRGTARRSRPRPASPSTGSTRSGGATPRPRSGAATACRPSAPSPATDDRGGHARPAVRARAAGACDAVDAALPDARGRGRRRPRPRRDRRATSCRPLVDLRPYAFLDARGAGEWWIASDLGELATGARCASTMCSASAAPR